MIWGRQGMQKSLCNGGQYLCPICRENQSHRLVASYTRHHLYLLWQWVTTEKYILTCERCGNGFSISHQKAQNLFGRDPISQLQRHAWIYASAATVILVFGYLIGKNWQQLYRIFQSYPLSHQILTPQFKQCIQPYSKNGLNINYWGQFLKCNKSHRALF